MKLPIDYETTSLENQINILWNKHIIAIIVEYCDLAIKRNLSEQEADRIAEIINLAEDDGCLEFWINEADHFLDHELNLLTEKTIYQVTIEEQKIKFFRHLNDIIERYKNEEFAELLKDTFEDKNGGSEVQLHLKEHGFYPGPIDGFFGPRTQAAIMSFQKSRNLDVNGKVDEATQLELGCGLQK